MATRQTGRFILWILASGVVVISALAIKVEVDKRKLASAYAQAQALAAQLDQERAHLSQELAQSRETLESQANDLTHLQAELATLETHLTQTEQELSNLKQTNESLFAQLTQTTQEKQALEARLSSLKELKLAIRAVRQQLWQQRWEAWLAKQETQRAKDRERLAQGNRGFLVAHGLSTVGSKTRLQVRVLEPQTQ